MTPFDLHPDANTIGSIAGGYQFTGSPARPPISRGLGIASIDWGCAVQITAAAAIGSGGEFSATDAETLYATTLFSLVLF